MKFTLLTNWNRFLLMSFFALKLQQTHNPVCNVCFFVCSISLSYVFYLVRINGCSESRVHLVWVCAFSRLHFSLFWNLHLLLIFFFFRPLLHFLRLSFELSTAFCDLMSQFTVLRFFVDGRYGIEISIPLSGWEQWKCQVCATEKYHVNGLWSVHGISRCCTSKPNKKNHFIFETNAQH